MALSVVNKVKPAQWGVSKHLVDPKWHWFWEKVLIAPPLWEGGGVNLNDPIARKQYSLVNMAPATDWVRTETGLAVDLGSGDDEHLLFDDTVLDNQTDLTFFYRYKTSFTGNQGLWSGANSVNDNSILIFHLNSTTIRFYAGASSADFDSYDVPSGTFDGTYRTYLWERDQTNSNMRFFLDDPYVARADRAETFTAIDLDAGGLLFGQEQDSVGGGFSNTQKAVGTADNLYVFEGTISDNERYQLFADPYGPFRQHEEDVIVLVPVVGGVDITVPLGTFTLAGQVPIVGSGASVAVPLGTFARTDFVPTINIGVNVITPLGTFTKTGFIPVINIGVNIITPLGTFTLTGFIPIITAGGIIIITPLRSFTVNFLAPSVASGVNVVTPLGTFSLTKFVPTIETGLNIFVPAGSFSLTSFIPTVITGLEIIIAVPLKTFTVTKFIPTIHSVSPAFKPLTEIDLTPPFEDIDKIRYLFKNFALLRDVLADGVTGQFTTTDGKTIHIRNGVVTDIF